MSTLRTALTKQPAILVKSLFRLERRGRYSEALAEVEHIWKDIRDLPDVDEFESYEAAEILLRCGSLIGFHGHNRQLQDAQERSRDILMAARRRFVELDNVEKIAECENYLALTYWRTGESSEAQTWLDQSSSRKLTFSNRIRLYSEIVQALINILSKQFEKNLLILKPLEQSFLASRDDCLVGDFYNHCGLAYKNLAYPLEALEHFELAKHYHQRSGHKIYLGTVENNLAQLYKEKRKFAKAHESIDHATRIFRQIKDKTREGFSYDTKALIFFAEAKYADALKAAEKGASILRKSENTAYLIETLLTKAKILLFLDNFSEAVLSLSDAVGMARVQTGDETAIRLIKEFEAALEERNTPPKKNLESGDFELILPQSISHFSDYRGIWINNTQLEIIGLVKGSLAIVVKAKVKCGDLIAVSEVESGEVSCGFYDTDFGIVCLEGADGEPQIFDEKEIRILGKIVGVCNSGRTEDGKMVVEALKI